MKHILSFLVLLLCCTSWGQDLYLVYFQPKQNTATYLAEPLTMLSQRALDRRTHRNIALDDKDVPIDAYQLNTLKQLNLNYVGASKWLNAAMVEVDDETVISQIQQLNFVNRVESLVRHSSARDIAERKQRVHHTLDFNYQNSANFIEQLNLQYFHNAGFTGQNIMVGVIDSGFPGVNSTNAFAALRNENRIVDSKNFVNSNSIYQMDSHGAIVLATMAAKLDGVYVGAAPDAHYALYVSEDVDVETPKELLYWVQAAERADSVGVDIINTSLGYSTFDDPRYDYTYAEMDGESSLITKGANIAYSRGIFLVNAMGNDGNNSWHFLTAPADSPQVFSIGANDINKNAGTFSSYGPNSINERKPNVSALGVSTPIYLPNGAISRTNGTSLSSPIITGAIATLMSAMPHTSLDDLKSLIEQSAHLYPNVNNQLGYGVPNFQTLYNQLATKELESIKVELYPNPVVNELSIHTKYKITKVEVLDWNGKNLKMVKDKNNIEMKELPSGVYFIRISLQDGKILNYKVLKK